MSTLNPTWYGEVGLPEVGTVETRIAGCWIRRRRQRECDLFNEIFSAGAKFWWELQRNPLQARKLSRIHVRAVDGRLSPCGLAGSLLSMRRRSWALDCSQLNRSTAMASPLLVPTRLWQQHRRASGYGASPRRAGQYICRIPRAAG